MELTPETLAGYRAIRGSVALADERDLRRLQLTGAGAFDALDAVCPCDVFLRDGAMKHTLLLNENGVPFADVYVCRDGESAYLLGYGPPGDDIAEWIIEHAAGTPDFSITNLDRSHFPFAIDGPYAWEYCAEVVGPDVLGMPYLGMVRLGGVSIFRAGRTGEYGYHLLVPHDERDEWLEKLLMAGDAFEMARADDRARAQCVMENFFFDSEREGRYGLTPFELQLQWRLSQEKEGYPGAEAIRAFRESGWDRRITCFITPEAVLPDEEIACDGERVGTVLAAGFSPLRKEFVGKALLRRPYWHAGLDAFRVRDVRLKTISAPAINNLSLKVNPYRHSFHTRGEDGE